MSSSTPPPPSAPLAPPPPPHSPQRVSSIPSTPTSAPSARPPLPPPLRHISISTSSSLSNAPTSSPMSPSTSAQLHPPALQRAHSTRKPRIPTSPPPTAEETDRDLLMALRRIGYTQYYELFTHHQLTAHTLRDFTSKQLRDDLNIRPLRHRREIARILNQNADLTPAQQVPDFGRILVHLSNVRTFHSWLVSGMQLVVLAMSIIRIAPSVRGAQLLATGGVTLVIVGVALQVYGGVRYWRVMRALERGTSFHADSIGTYGILILAIAVAALVLYILLKDGFAR